jgi:HEPN domain-containing protein
MLPKSFDADDPRRWMSFAKSDLKLAKSGHLPGIRLESLCCLTQQAAEKSLKAVLMNKKIHFPKTHQIQVLIELLPPGILIPTSVKEAAELSEYAVEGRYPQNFEDVTKKEYLSALKKARAVVLWAEKSLK